MSAHAVTGRHGVDLAHWLRVWLSLAGDRFAREPAGVWRDIVTGWSVELVVHEAVDDWDARARRKQSELFTRGADGRTLLDFGRLGTTQQWFEAFVDASCVSRPAGDIDAAVREALAAPRAGATSAWSVVELAVAWPGDCDALRVRLGRALREPGFVVLGAGVRVSSDLADALGHRHVALVCEDNELPDARRWIGALSSASPRGHLLCRLISGRTANRPCRARERTVRYTAGGGHRRESVAAPYLRIETLIGRGELGVAEKLIGAARADAALAGLDVPPEVALLDAQVCFWRGRFDSARVRLLPLDSCAERTGWLGLIDWAVFDLAGLSARRRTCLRAARSGGRAASFWASLLARLSGEDDTDLAGMPGHTRPIAPAWRAAGGFPALALLAKAECALVQGDVARVDHWCEGHRSHGTDLLALAVRWLLAERRPDGAAAVRRELFERGALGMMRWGQGRERMRILHFVPGLLQVVHEAEDEGVALVSGCSWVRTHTRARGVAVVSRPDGRVVAQEGWTHRQLAAGDLANLCREVLEVSREPEPATGAVRVAAPVRYGGAIIGHVVGLGSSEEVTAVEDAIQAFAALCGPALRARLDARQIPDDPSAMMPELIGWSPGMAAVRESVRQAARTGFAVLIEGESGTGKELVARALHRLSDRRTKRFMAVNCAALTDDLVEAELFGFARGAFTGAVANRPGLFEDASGGSMFLDEVSELSARAQAKLLRALQEREVRRVGENTTRPVNVRLIAATNQPLVEAVARGRFRKDLLFRLAVVRIVLPPLRERLEDLPALATAFWRQALVDVGKQVRLTRDAMGALCSHGWPGNVRELQNVMAGLAVRAPRRGRIGGRQVRLHLSGAPSSEMTAQSLDALRRQCERRAVAGALARHGGRRTAAARELGLSRQGLSKAIRRLGLDSAGETPEVA